MVRKVRTEFSQIVAFRSHVVINHVQHDSQARSVAGIHQLFQSLGSTVGSVWSEKIDTVVTPVPAAGKLRGRHQFYRGNAEVLEIRNLPNHGFESSFPRKGSRVQ